MKRILICLLCLLLCGSMLFGCAPTEEPAPETDDQTQPEQQPDPEPEPEPEPEPVRTDFRVLLSSDIHCTHLLEWYGVNYRDRMQLWVDAIIAEHEERPIDLLILNGDLSLDHWQHNGGGSWLNEERSTTEEFVNDFVSQLPAEIPVFIMPGNHEQFSNDDWDYITGNDRYGYYVLGEHLFVFLDNFAGELDPDYHHDGVYTGVDMEYLTGIMAEHPNKNVWLVGHYFDMSKESEEFKELLCTNTDIKALFHGHIHLTDVQELGEEYNDLTIAVTGNFAYTKDADILGSFWGFRELVISENSAYSCYILAESEAVVNGKNVVVEREEIDEVIYY
jgi:3',5'-cyclic AMP phosphodiesterase CpdA